MDAGVASQQPSSSYVRAEGPKLFLDGQPFRFEGFNAQQTLSWAASGSPTLMAELEALFADAQQLGLRVARVWASHVGPKMLPPFLDGFNERVAPQFAEPPSILVMQPAPGELNETVLQALDLVLDAAGRHGIKLTLNLADYTGRFGPSLPGIEPYIQWVAGTLNLTGYTVLDFFEDERAKLLFKHRVCALASRRSSVDGVRYRDSPHIFAWDLLNEPRCPACPGGPAPLVAWADEMSSILTCIDPNHMVGISTEGFFSEADPQYIPANPGPWALCEGVGFCELASLPHISYGAAHMYASTRGTWDEATRSTCGWDCAMRWFRSWMAAHFDASSVVTGKPFVLEEFSAQWSEEQRNDMFRLEAFASEWVNASSVAAGAVFWGGTVGDHVDWDGWQIRLDGGRSVPAPFEQADLLKQGMPPEQKQRDEADKACQAAVKAKYASVFAGYGSNSTFCRRADAPARGRDEGASENN
ncbi:hypothetical protein ABPG77_006507 [Micractinium sp. CCAP 211/92]